MNKKIINEMAEIFEKHDLSRNEQARIFKLCTELMDRPT